MIFLNTWEIIMIMLFIIELFGTSLDNNFKDLASVENPFHQSLRVKLAIGLYLVGIYFGKYRMAYFFVFISNGLIFILSFSPFSGLNWYLVLTGQLLAGIFVTTTSYTKQYIINGPYGVGYKEFKLKSGNQPWISGYYPIDKVYYEEYKSDESKNIGRMRDGFKTAKGVAIGFNEPPHFLLRYLTQERIEVIKDHQLHKDFTTGNKKLIPVVFSHGLIVNRTNHSSIGRELASHGCIVYALDHTDGSSSYFVDTTKNPPQERYYTEYNAKIHNFSQEIYRQRQLVIRLDDIEQLLKHIKETELKAIPSIDMNKLVCSGHSMGGMTTLEACYKFDDFKYCIPLDPFFRARFEQIEKDNKFVVKQPMCIISTEYFHRRTQRFLENFDSMSILFKFFKDCESAKRSKNQVNYNIIIKNTHHLNQYDMCLEGHKLLSYFGQMTWTCNPHEKMKENNFLILGYLNECKLLEVPCDLKVMEVLLAK